MYKGIVSGFVFLLCFSSQNMYAQNMSIGWAEKCWALSHPFKIKDAYRITFEVKSICDSLAYNHGITGNAGGKLDAFRHTYWMALLRQFMSRNACLKLGIAHEKTNYKQFVKLDRMDENRPDSTFCVMDLHNNKQGVFIGEQLKGRSKSDITESIVEAYNSGKLKVCRLSKDNEFLDCDGNRIQLEDFKDSWHMPRCLINSSDW